MKICALCGGPDHPLTLCGPGAPPPEMVDPVRCEFIGGPWDGERRWVSASESAFVVAYTAPRPRTMTVEVGAAGWYHRTGELEFSWYPEETA